MLRDSENHEIVLLDKPNGHVVIVGKSGFGKTYFTCRQLEDQYKRGKKSIVFDYSASYTVNELKKNKFCLLDEIMILNPAEEQIIWNLQEDYAETILIAAFINSLQIASYYQKSLLKNIIGDTFDKYREFSMGILIQEMEKRFFDELNPDKQKNLGHLLTRLDPYSSIDGIIFKKGRIQENTSPITIFQISDYPEIERKFLMGFLSEILWNEIRQRKKGQKIIIFDEFQNLDLTSGSAIPSMLREGRKFGLALYLASQFVNNYDKEVINTIFQAANLIVFRPVESEIPMYSGYFDMKEKAFWEKELARLQIGQCVVSGSCILSGKNQPINRPIICCVK